MKYCPKCETDKPITEFWKNKTTTDGFQCWCKDCWKKTTADRRNGPKRDIELRQRRNGHLVRKYGITISEYDDMLKKQGGGCAICKTSINQDYRNLVVDHCHKTNKVRGLLCSNCNRALGLFYDNIKTMENAIEYLNKDNGWW